MQGQRVYPQDNELYLKAGEYGIHPRDKRWYARAPKGHMAALDNHQVTEHEDGTITVLPSILVYGWDAEHGEKAIWHGYLEHGVWREV